MHLIHDVRLVFMFIRTCLEEVRQRSGKRAVPHAIEQADLLVETGLSLVNDLLLDRALKPIAPSVEVNHVVAEFDAVLMTIAGPEIGVSTRLVSGDTRVYAQRADLERILLNVAFNATTAMPLGGSLLIDTELTEGDGNAPFGYLLLTVRDDGCGMSDAQVAGAIDPAATAGLDGSGIGLASVALVLARLGGKLAIESELDRGTKVTISIPLAGAGQVH